MSTRHTEILPTKSGGDDKPAFQQGIHRLPVELLDLALQCLWDSDKPTIIACSQVSRLWHEVARPYLFAFLKITSRSDFVEFLASLHAHPDTTRHVRKLELKNAQTRIL